MFDPQQALSAFGERLTELGWVTDLWVGGSLATGDYISGVSDMDLVALVDGEVVAARQSDLSAIHAELEVGVAAGADLGCVYVDAGVVEVAGARHPTWTHGGLVQRALSGISRAELVRHGYAHFGRPPATVLRAMSDDDVRQAAQAEMCGYWAWASRRPTMWLDPVIADLGLTAMARGRYALTTGRLLTKSEAIEQARAPRWLVDQLRARRHGDAVESPRLHTAWVAWRDCRTTVSWARSLGTSDA